MKPDADPTEAGRLERTYKNLIDLWTSGVRDYHSLLSDYLTANSIFVAAIGFLVTQRPASLIFSLLVPVLCVFGLLMTLQMAIVLGRFSAQNDLWEWQLRGIEKAAGWTDRRLFEDLHRFRDRQESLEDKSNEPALLSPNRVLRLHRQWWAHRATTFPLFFGIIYGLFLIWGLTHLHY
jgi:hypothetical protein